MRETLDRGHKARDDQAEVPLELLARADESKRTFRIVLGSISGISLLLGGGLIGGALGLGIPLVVEAFVGM